MFALLYSIDDIAEGVIENVFMAVSEDLDYLKDLATKIDFWKNLKYYIDGEFRLYTNRTDYLERFNDPSYNSASCCLILPLIELNPNTFILP